MGQRNIANSGLQATKHEIYKEFQSRFKWLENPKRPRNIRKKEREAKMANQIARGATGQATFGSEHRGSAGRSESYLWELNGPDIDGVGFSYPQGEGADTSGGESSGWFIRSDGQVSVPAHASLGDYSFPFHNNDDFETLGALTKVYSFEIVEGYPRWRCNNGVCQQYQAVTESEGFATEAECQASGCGGSGCGGSGSGGSGSGGSGSGSGPNPRPPIPGPSTPSNSCAR